jgi:hypothetical protein
MRKRVKSIYLTLIILPEMIKLLKTALASFGLVLCVFAQDLDYSNKFLVERIYLMPFVFKYADQLGVEEDQLNKLKRFVKDHEREVSQNIQLLNYLDRKAKMMILNGSEEKELRQVLADIAYLKTELTLMNAKSVRVIKEILTPEQFEKLKDIMIVRLFEISQ